MFLRLVFVLLIACNIAAAAWLLLGQDDTYGHGANDPDVPELHLLTEQPAVAATAHRVAAAASSLTPASPPPSAPAAAATQAKAPAPTPQIAPVPHHTLACLTLGPFATPEDLRDARSAVGGQAVRTRARQEQAMQTKGWWVHLPTSSSREQALALAKKLTAQHISDFFVVNSGDQPNTVSLGLFKDPGNARKRRDEVAAAGFPAQVTERTERVPEYWLDLVVSDGDHFDWHSRLHNAPASVGSHTTGCF